ncbi:MAG: (d)CMP kinase [Cyanobacteria bacterium SZAS LIN-2]|nr:(d)CMP kinase [Cyanobacteria bacterium SZAS LIN-2]MBS2006650.1 (d)CMP kinase [Cyanobacteria bacterium SZAS TMP-1]
MGDKSAKSGESQTEATQFGALQIAIDGPAGAGKSTVARRLAESLGYLYIDTGAMYRTATWLARKHNLSLSQADEIAQLAAGSDIVLKPADETSEGRIRVFVNGEEVTMAIRTREITEWASPVSALAPLRTVLVKKQQQLASSGAAVLDGRDIGTVVLPNAGLKIFLTASPDVRARRCLIDLERQGEKANFDELLKAINERDHRDSTRDVSPLTKAEDAIEVSTDNLSIDQVVDKLMSLVKSRLQQSTSKSGSPA